MESEYVEPLCVCGKRFIEHEEPCTYWYIDFKAIGKPWRCIYFDCFGYRNQPGQCSNYKHDPFKMWIMPFKHDTGYKLDLSAMVEIKLERSFCIDMGINFRGLDA